MKLLRKFIKRAISEETNLDEAARTYSEAESEGLALAILSSGTGDIFALYDPIKLASDLKRSMLGEFNYDTFSDLISNSIIGYINTSLSKCEGITQVNFSAATGGFGPLVYDIAMSKTKHSGSPWIISDRVGVSADAKRIWSFYLNYRDDIDKEPLDEESKCFKLKAPDSQNYKYRIKSPISYQSLVEKHKKFVGELAKIIGRNLSPLRLHIAFDSACSTFFLRMYH